MDTRAYRLEWAHPVQVYEIDRPAVLAVKEAALARYSPARNVTRKAVGTDLLTDDWRAALAAAGFERSRRAVWLLEGLLYYIPEENTRRLLVELQELCPSGSPIAFDVVNQVALTAPSTRKLLQLFTDWGSPWLFGSDEPEELMASYGFRATAVQPGEPGAHYGRWKDSVMPRDVPDIARVFYVTGERM
jgi:methyltransferase (TIGR00027 family)